MKALTLYRVAGRAGALYSTLEEALRVAAEIHRETGVFVSVEVAQ